MSAPDIIIPAPVGGGTPVGGSGTPNTIPRWTGASTLGDSELVQTSTALMTLGGTSATQRTFRVQTVGTANNAPIYSLFRGGVNEHVIWAGSSTTRFGIARDPAGYTDAQLLAATLFAIDSTGNVGIGTASPVAKAHISQSSGGSPALLVEGVGVASWIRLVGGGSNNTIDSDDDLIFRVGSSYTERARIDSTGNVGIGTAGPGALLHLEKALGLTANAEIFRLRNSTVGSGSNVSQTFYVHGNSVATGNISHAWNGTTYDTIFSVWNGSALAEAGRAIGGSTPVLSVPSGLKLPATPGNPDTQTLDCYEENTWTPTRAGFGGTNPTVTASYTRVGRLVTITVRIVATGGAQYSGTSPTTTLSIPATITPSTNTTASSIMVYGDTTTVGTVTAWNDGLIYLPTFALTTQQTAFSITYRV